MNLGNTVNINYVKKNTWTTDDTYNDDHMEATKTKELLAYTSRSVANLVRLQCASVTVKSEKREIKPFALFADASAIRKVRKKLIYVESGQTTSKSR